MPLTKVRPPVTSISEMLNGTTNIDIPTAGASIDVNVAGTSVLDLTQTSVDIPDAITLTAKDLNSESIDLSTTSGAAGTLETNATLMRLLATSAHELLLGANNSTNLTLQTTGKVGLAAEGTAVGDLVTKAYVDGAADTSQNGITATIATEGQLSLPTDAGTLILKWGRPTGLVAQAAATVITYPTPFPNATLWVHVQAIRTLGVGEFELFNTSPGATTAANFEVYKPIGDGSLNPEIYYLALGF